MGYIIELSKETKPDGNVVFWVRTENANDKWDVAHKGFHAYSQEEISVKEREAREYYERCVKVNSELGTSPIKEVLATTKVNAG